jgi:hypothetical protein
VDSQSPGHILRALLKQVLYINGTIPPQLAQAYHKEGSDGGQLPGDQAIKLLDELLTPFHRRYIILDGLDEMNNHTNRRSLLQHLLNLGCRPRLMITTRPSVEYDGFFGEDLPEICCSQCNAVELAWYSRCEHCEKFTLCLACVDAGLRCQIGNHTLEKRSVRAKMEIMAQPEDIRIYVSARISANDTLATLVGKQLGLEKLIVQGVLDHCEKM